MVASDAQDAAPHVDWAAPVGKRAVLTLTKPIAAVDAVALSEALSPEDVLANPALGPIAFVDGGTARSAFLAHAPMIGAAAAGRQACQRRWISN